MKKVTIFLVAAMLVFGITANSKAASVYDTFLSVYGYKNADGVNQNGVSSGKTFGDYEATYNFGMPLDVATSAEHFDQGGKFDGATINTGIFLDDLTCTGVDSWNDVQVAAYASLMEPGSMDIAGSYLTAVDEPTINDSAWNPFDSAVGNIVGGVAPEALASNVYDLNDANSYVSQMNTGIIGAMQGYNENGEMNLGNLDNDGVATLSLYKVEGADFSPRKLGTFTFSTDASDQSLVADYSAVPVPAPLLLLGSGLLGLLGFRRKNA